MKEEGKKKQVEQEKEEERSWKKQGEEKWKKGEMEKEEKEKEEEEEEEENWKQGKGKWNRKDEECLTMEQIFELQPVPSWQEQLTFRALVVSFVLGIFFSVIVMKLSLTTGIIPSLNIAAGLLSYFMVGIWAKILQRLGFLKQPFTRQENTIVQTCVIASSGISFSGGFGSYLFGMSRRIAKQTEKSVNSANVKDPALGWMIGFLFIVSFVGLLVVLPLRKIMIVDHKLTYPSGTATAHLINSFHTPHGARIVQKQVSVLFKCFICSFFWAFFQWFYTAGEGCGFSSFPTFGLTAYQNKFYFDFSATYVGVGMLCPYIVNISLLAGSIISWGIMWPIIESKRGKWYSDKIPLSSFHGLQGYKIFIGTAMILGDGLFQFSSMLTRTIRVISTENRRNESSSTLLPDDDLFYDCSSIGYDEMRRREVFLKDPIPIKYAFAGYFFLATISMIAIPYIFHNLRWYHIMAMYIIAPVFAFSNSYGCGLTDWSVASNYGKLAIMIFGSWVGSHGGVLAGLASCTVLMSIVSSASDLMQDFKTGYLTLASPRSMLISQVVGTAMGCVIAPSIFWIYYKAFPIGIDGTIYPAPYATVNRGLALLSIEGVSSLPKHCVKLCVIFFFVSFFFSAFKELMKNSQNRLYYYLPSIMAMAIPFFLGPYFAIDMCVGNIILYMWEKKNLRHAQAFSSVVATGMICGDGIWSLPSSILSLVKVKPPICMRFLSAVENERVSEFLGS